MRISVPAGKMMTVDNLETDDTFWKVFSFDFIAGVNIFSVFVKFLFHIGFSDFYSVGIVLA